MAVGIRDDSGEGHDPECPGCGWALDWEECWHCHGEGGFDGEEEDPLWFEPGEIDPCNECRGQGHYWFCGNKKCERTIVDVPDQAVAAVRARDEAGE